MSRLNKEFDRVVCINLSERPDKRAEMEEKFVELDIDVKWYTATKYGFLPNIVQPINNSGKGSFNSSQPYEIGASLSHYSVIKNALNDGAESIFVFEDDVLFHKDFNSQLDKCMDDLPEDWDMIMLYSFMYHILPQNVRVRKRWIKSFRSWSLMAYGMTKPVMEEYIKRQDRYFTIADSVTYKMQEEGKFNIYSVAPSLCIPKADSSDIRTVANYIQNPTAINFGYPNTNYK